MFDITLDIIAEFSTHHQAFSGVQHIFISTGSILAGLAPSLFEDKDTPFS